MIIEVLHPQRLWALLAVPILLAAYLGLLWVKTSSKRRQGPSSLDGLIRKQAGWKRHAAVATAVLSLASLVVAWATPVGFIEVPRERATVIVAIDVSNSMKAEDVKPNRLVAAQTAAKEFLGMVPKGFNVGLVVFAGSASLIVPPTVDRGAVSAAIDKIQLAPSTAIGDGIYSSLDALDLVPPDPKDPDATPPAAIVLLSDGESNMGKSSTGAAQAAKKRGVPVFTIAYGTPGGYVVDRGQRMPVPVNHVELQRIADLSGGKKYSAASASELKSVYEGIARSIGYEKVQTEVTEKYVFYALLFGVASALAAIALGARWPS